MEKRTALLEKYYNKFNEEHRLTTRHGIVEFTTTLKYIHDFLPKDKDSSQIKILDIGAGTGRYSVSLVNEGYDVTAVELVKRNIETLRAKHTPVKTWQGNATNLHFLPDETFDITLMLGPMYHINDEESKLKAFAEAKRVTKKGGFIFVAYVMNEYSVISYCFKENKIKECLQKGTITQDFHTISDENELYNYVRLEDINRLNEFAQNKRVKIIAADGPSDYMRRELNAMDEETFELFVQYHLATCERPELMGATSHTVDILQNV